MGKVMVRYFKLDATDSTRETIVAVEYLQIFITSLLLNGYIILEIV